MSLSALRSIVLVCTASLLVAVLSGCATRIPAEVSEDTAFVVFAQNIQSGESGQLYFDYRIELDFQEVEGQRETFMVRTSLGNPLTIIEFDEPGAYSMDQVVFISKRKGRNSIRTRSGNWNVRSGHINIYSYVMNTTVENNTQFFRFVRITPQEMEDLVERLHEEHPESRGWPINVL